MKTCLVCRKPVDEEGNVLLQVDSSRKEKLELRYHDACKRTYVLEKSLLRDADNAKELWEQRVARWFKRVRLFPQRYP